MGGHSPRSSEALEIQPLGDKEQQGSELFECLGWKCELKLIHLCTKLLSEVLSHAVFLHCKICLLKIPQSKRSGWGGCIILPLLSLSLQHLGGEIPFDICLF